jgi:putative membrane protein
MTESESTAVRGEVYEPSILKGLIAGLFGGLAGTVAKTFAERLFPPRTHGEGEPPVKLAEQVAERPLSNTEQAVASESIHWVFGAATGAAYGALAEYYPAATAKGGASFGMALEALTHETALPALGISGPPEDQTTRERASEITSHVVYGIATEMVRSFVRKML